MRTFLVLGLLSLYAAPAHAGWYARQVDKTPGQVKADAAEIYYEGGKIRIDQGKNTSVIYDLSNGAISILNHLDKSYMSHTVEDLAKMRDAMVKQLRAQLDQMEPKMRAQIEPRLKEMESGGADDVKPVSSGKKAKVGKFNCEIYTWKTKGGEGEVCLANDVGVNLSEFATHAQKLSSKLKELRLGGGQPGANMAMLEMAKTGFPVRTRSKIELSPGNVVETIAEVDEIRSEKVPPAKFDVPADYKKQQMPQGPMPMK